MLFFLKLVVGAFLIAAGVAAEAGAWNAAGVAVCVFVLLWQGGGSED